MPTSSSGVEGARTALLIKARYKRLVVEAIEGAYNNTQTFAKGPITVCFSQMRVLAEDVPQWKFLGRELSRLSDAAKTPKEEQYFKTAGELLDEQFVDVLKISDYNTRSLDMDRMASTVAFFACSKLRTVLSYSLDFGGGKSYSEVCRPCPLPIDPASHQIRAFYDSEDAKLAMDPCGIRFSGEAPRKIAGNDIYIVCNENPPGCDVGKLLRELIVENFMISIMMGKVVVKVDSTDIDIDYIEDYFAAMGKRGRGKLAEENPRQLELLDYYRILDTDDPMNRHILLDSNEYGSEFGFHDRDCELVLRPGEDLNNKILVSNGLGKRLFEFKAGHERSFSGVLYLYEWTKMGKLFKKMQDPYRNTWKPDPSAGDYQKQVDAYEGLKTYLRHKVDELFEEPGSDEETAPSSQPLPVSDDAENAAPVQQTVEDSDSRPIGTQPDVPVAKNLVVDFSDIGDLSNTIPVSISYFGTKLDGFSSWPELYTAFLSFLYPIFRHWLKPGMSFSLGRSGPADLYDESEIDSLIRPEQVPGTALFVETCLDVNALVRKIKNLLDFCGKVDYKNVVIEYQERESAVSGSSTADEPTKVQAPEAALESPAQETEHKVLASATPADTPAAEEPVPPAIKDGGGVEERASDTTDEPSSEETAEDSGSSGTSEPSSLETTDEAPREEPRSSGNKEDFDINAFKDFLVSRQGLSKDTCFHYVASMRWTEGYAAHKGFHHHRLFTTDPDEAKATVEALERDPFYSQYNKKENYRFSAAIEQLFKYMNVDYIPEKPASSDCVAATVSEIDSLLSDEMFLPLREALAKDGIRTVEELKSLKLWPFMNRNNLYSIPVRQSVLVKVRHLLEPKAEPQYVSACTIFWNSVAYQGDTPAKAFLRFCEAVAEKYPLLFRSFLDRAIGKTLPVTIHRTSIDGDFLKMENPLCYVYAKLGINEVLSAADWISRELGGGSISIAMPPKKVSAAQSDSFTNRQEAFAAGSSKLGMAGIEKLVQNAAQDGMTYENLSEMLHKTVNTARELVSNCGHIIEIKGKLVHEASFIDWDAGAEKMLGIMRKLMQKNNGYVSAPQLFEYARSEMNMFLNDNGVKDERSVYEIARHLFQKNSYGGESYSFNGKSHISKASDTINSTFELIKKYSEEHGGVFREDDLAEYLEGVGIKNVYIRAQMRLNKESVFFLYEPGRVISAKSMGIDDSWKRSVGMALKKLLDDADGHIILRDIPQSWFGSLPGLSGDGRWTPLLLQFVLRFFGEELGARTIAAMDSQGLDTLHAMLVSYESPIRNFGDTVICFLNDRCVKQRIFDAEKLRQMLVRAGMLMGNELISNMPKALAADDRFAWDSKKETVTVRAT